MVFLYFGFVKVQPFKLFNKEYRSYSWRAELRLLSYDWTIIVWRTINSCTGRLNWVTHLAQWLNFFFFFFLRILSQWFVDNNFIVKNINKEVFESIVEVAPGTKRFHRCQLFFIVNDPDGCCREQLAESLFTVVCVRAEKRKLRGLLLRLWLNEIHTIFFHVPQRCTDLDPADCLLTGLTVNTAGGCVGESASSAMLKRDNGSKKLQEA